MTDGPTKVPLYRTHDALEVDRRARELLAMPSRNPQEETELDVLRSLRKRLLHALRCAPEAERDVKAIAALGAKFR